MKPVSDHLNPALPARVTFSCGCPEAESLMQELLTQAGSSSPLPSNSVHRAPPPLCTHLPLASVLKAILTHQMLEFQTSASLSPVGHHNCGPVLQNQAERLPVGDLTSRGNQHPPPLAWSFSKILEFSRLQDFLMLMM